MNNKRETLKKVAGVSAVVALAPSSWTKPVLSSVVLPAHAQTSANQAPTFTQDVFNTGIVVTDDTDNGQVILDLNSVTNDANGDTLAYTIVDGSISVPGNELPLYSNVFEISSGVLQAIGLFTADPDLDGSASLIVQVSDGTLSSQATVNFTFDSNR